MAAPHGDMGDANRLSITGTAKPHWTGHANPMQAGLMGCAAATTERVGALNRLSDSLALQETVGGAPNRKDAPHWLILWASEQQRRDNLSEAMTELLDLVTRDVLVTGGTIQYANGRTSNSAIVSGDFLNLYELRRAKRTLECGGLAV